MKEFKSNFDLNPRQIRIFNKLEQQIIKGFACSYYSLKNIEIDLPLMNENETRDIYTQKNISAAEF
jgi:hypothetical protein